jgi:hypothetical protein
LVFLELRELLNSRAVGLDTLVAHHAIGDLGGAHFIAVCLYLMAGVAIQSVLNVELVTEWDGLGDCLGGRRDLGWFTPQPRRNRSRLILWSTLHDNVGSFRNEGEGCEDVVAGGIEIEMPAGPRRHYYELLIGFLPHVSDGCRLRVAFELGDPQLFSGLGIEGAEAPIDGGANEDQSPRRGDGTAEVIESGWGIPFAASSSTTPRGTFQASLPVFRSMALRSPQRGCWQG